MTPQTASSIAVHCSHDALVDITAIVANPRNPNRHPDKQVALLAKIIRHQGWRAPVVVSKRSGFVVAGHGRLEAAKLLQVQAVPVNFQEFATEADEWAHVIADNRIVELAETDGAMLKDLLIELDSATQDFDMDLSGFDKDELERVINSYNPDAPSIGKTGNEHLMEYLNRDTRQVVLGYSGEEFGEVVELLAALREHFQTENNSDSVLALLRQWKQSN
jgi:hypothetical protein